MFIRKRGGSHQLIETYREGGKVKQRQIANLGPCTTIAAAIAYWEDERARFTGWHRKNAVAKNLAALRSVKPVAVDTTAERHNQAAEQPPKLRVVSTGRPVDTTAAPPTEIVDVETIERRERARTAPVEPRRDPAPAPLRTISSLADLERMEAGGRLEPVPPRPASDGRAAAGLKRRRSRGFWNKNQGV